MCVLELNFRYGDRPVSKDPQNHIRVLNLLNSIYSPVNKSPCLPMVALDAEVE